MNLNDKIEIFKLVINDLEKNLKVLVESAFEAKEASTNEESKAENKYDTRGLEASYLASGQAKRAQELQEKIYLLKKVEVKDFSEEDSIGISSLIKILIDDSEQYFFIIPAGGIEVKYKNQSIKTINIESPLGSQIFGQKLGHDFQLNNKEYEVVEVF